MSAYFVKNPDSALDFTFDWGFQFLEPGEQIETDLGWSVTPDTAADGGLAVTDSAQTFTTTTAILGAGRAGEAYLVQSRIRTDRGREIQRALTIRVANV